MLRYSASENTQLLRVLGLKERCEMADGTGSSSGGAGGSGGSDQNKGQDQDSGGAGGSGGSDQNKGQDQALQYEEWLKGQPEEVKTMLGGWEKGLKTALKDERDARGDLEKKLRDLAGKAEKGSEAEKKLIEMADQMAEGDRRATFYEEAHKAGVSNLKLAYLVVVQEDLFDKRGNVNIDALKKDYPELFDQGAPKTKGNAGDGTETQQPAHVGMNEFIRASAGKPINQ